MTELEALRKVAEAARDTLVRVDRPMRDKLPALAATLDALDAAEPDGWRAARPGWYWVRLSEHERWYPYEWKVGRTSDGWWVGLDNRTQPIEIGHALPPPPAARQEGDK